MCNQAASELKPDNKNFLGLCDALGMSKLITIGGMSCDQTELLKYVEAYLDPKNQFAYPAYDAYEGSGAPEVRDADLLAIALLNAGQKPLPTYYTLQSMLGIMNERLADSRLRGNFAEASDGTMEAISNLVGILDVHPSTSQVGKTKLLKVLHRKRPGLIPLYDENIRQLYSETDNPPVPRDPKRTHREFALAWLPAVQHDFKVHMDVWLEIVDMTAGRTPITPLRAMDIVAWEMGAHVRNPNRNKLNLEPRNR